MTCKRYLRNLRHGALLLVIAVYSIFPIYFMVIQSLKTPQEDVHGSPLIVVHPTYENYLELFEPPEKPRGYLRVPTVPFLLWMRNSAIVLLASLVVTLVISVLAAYGLGRLRPPGWRWWRRLLLASYLIPHTILFVPLYQVVVALDLDNNILALILVYQMLAMPFCVWLLSAHFQNLPRDIEESAYIEGAGRVAAFVRLVLPMSRPVLIAAGVFALGTIASDFMLASIFLTGAEHQTVAAGLGTMDVSLEELTVVAGVNLAAIPVVLVCALFARDYVRGITAAMLEGA
jgi:multiple sugar transport system permease protein